MTSMLTSDEVVKEQIFQTISKNVLRSSKNQKLSRAFHTHPTSGLGVLCGLRLAVSELEVLYTLRFVAC